MASKAEAAAVICIQNEPMSIRVLIVYTLQTSVIGVMFIVNFEEQPSLQNVETCR